MHNDLRDNQNKKGASITRVLQIIEAVAQSNGAIYPIDLAQQLNIPKPSIHRLLQQLQQEGFLKTDINGAIISGPRSLKIAVGIWYNKQYKLEREAILSKLVAQTQEDCGIAFADGLEMVYSDRIAAQRPLQVYLPAGTRMPIWATASGKLFLSTLDERKFKNLIKQFTLEKLTHNTITLAKDLITEVTAIKKTQIGIDNEEFVAGMVACAVPIFGEDNRFLASLYIHAPTIRCSVNDLMQFLPLLQQAAQEIRAVSIKQVSDN